MITPFSTYEKKQVGQTGFEKSCTPKYFIKLGSSLFNTFLSIYIVQKDIKLLETSNDIIAKNGKVLKAYMFIVWLYLFEKNIYCNYDFLFFPTDALYCYI